VFQSFLPLRFPEADQAMLLWVGAGLCLLFLVAVLIEMLRRRNNQRRLTEAEWETIRRIIGEKEFSKQEEELLISLIRRRAADAPLRTVTARRDFDSCVEAEMSALLAEGNEERFRETGILLREIRVRFDLDYVPFGQRIHSTRELHTGQEVWLAPATARISVHNTGGGSGQWTRGSVIAVDEAYLHVAGRDERGVNLGQGRELRCHFWREDDARYELTTTVASSEGAPPTWSLFHSDSLRRIQARDYYRIRCNQETTIGVLSAFGSDTEDLRQRRVVTRLRGRITSLSAGGLAVVTQHAVQAQTMLRVAIELPNEAPFETEVNTVAVQPIAGGRCLVRGSFVNIQEEKRDAIAHYVMRRQQPQFTPRETLPGERGVEKPE